MKYFFLGCIIFVVGALGLGFYFSGTPQNARLERLDNVRVSNLANIQNTILNFYTTKKQLPNNIDQLVQYEVSNFYNDPESKLRYEYNKKSEIEFSLCATFSLKSDEMNITFPYYYSSHTNVELIGDMTWNHTAGYVCFSRKIDTRNFVPSVYTVPKKL